MKYLTTTNGDEIYTEEPSDDRQIHTANQASDDKI